jgi:rod shape-determining protein MreD
MIDRAWPAAAALALASILQVSIAPHLAIGSVVPNLMLLVVVTIALTEGPNAGCVVGFFAGLLLDLLGAGPIGLWALVLCVVGYLAGQLEAQMFAHGWLLPVTVVLFASLSAEVAYGIVLSIVGVGDDIWATFGKTMLPGTLYNTVLAVLVYPWLARMLRREPAVTVVRRLL